MSSYCAFVFIAFLRKYDVDEFHLAQAYTVMENLIHAENCTYIREGR